MTARAHPLWLLVLLLGALAAHALAGGQVWFQNNTTKVFRDDPPGEVTAVRLTAARNEVESFQIVIRAGEEVLRKVAVEVSDLTGAANTRIGADRIELFRVAYVHLPSYGRDYPDALPPWSPCDIPAGWNQPVWVDISVPPDAAPGSYHGTISIRPEHGPVTEWPLELMVWDFALPVTPRSRTSFGIYQEGIAFQHGVELGGEQHRSLVRKYCEMLVAHRAMPRDLVVGALESPEAERYLDDPRVNAFMLPYSDDVAVLKRQAAYVRQKGWLAKAYYYVMDEPTSKEHYDLLRERAAKIHGVDPELKVMLPYHGEPRFEAEGGVYGLLTGLCDIWCPNLSFYREDALTARQKLGEEVWVVRVLGTGRALSQPAG